MIIDILPKEVKLIRDGDLVLLFPVNEFNIKKDKDGQCKEKQGKQMFFERIIRTGERAYRLMLRAVVCRRKGHVLENPGWELRTGNIHYRCQRCGKRIIFPPNDVRNMRAKKQFMLIFDKNGKKD